WYSERSLCAFRRFSFLRSSEKNSNTDSGHEKIGAGQGPVARISAPGIAGIQSLDPAAGG
ncbi:hypothetical protein, partial [Arthrobacter cavernae]